MNEWLADAIEQICLGDLLAETKEGFGRRFAMIAIDNSIEYALISYVEVFKRLVGGHIPGGIEQKAWIEKRRYFEQMLDYVASKEPGLSKYVDNIKRFHRMRDDLYHSGTPLTVNESTVKEYSEIAKRVLELLFSINYGDNEWRGKLDQVRRLIVGDTKAVENKDVITFERAAGVVKYSTSLTIKTPSAIRFILHGYALVEGREPTSDEVERSLRLSGNTASKEVIASRIAEMRAKGLIYSGRFSLKEKGRKDLREKYTFRVME
jgi:hypothetical protein